MSPRAASSRTWPVTSKRWFSPGVSGPRTVETSAPVFGSTALRLVTPSSPRQYQPRRGDRMSEVVSNRVPTDLVQAVDEAQNQQADRDGQRGAEANERGEQSGNAQPGGSREISHPALVRHERRYFLNTRWYLFPVLYLNFSYFGYRFVHVQDSTYVVMLVVIMAALWLARGHRTACHVLMAIAITMKLSPLYYSKNVFGMTRRMAMLFVAILVVGLVWPYFIWDTYPYIYRYGIELKGHWYDALGALVIVVPLAIVLWYVRRHGYLQLDCIRSSDCHVVADSIRKSSGLSPSSRSCSCAVLSPRRFG